MHYQTSGNNIDKPYIIILTRCNRKALVYSDLDTFISNNIPNITIETINIMFMNNKTVTIQKLKSGDVIITFKEEVTEYKKENN